MGAQQSKTAVDASNEKALLERLRRIQVADDNFVNVDGSSPSSSSSASGADNEKSDVRLTREPEGLPVQQTQSWQSRFLSDPKNKYSRRRRRTGGKHPFHHGRNPD